MNRFKEYLQRKEKEYEELISELERQARAGLDPSDEDIDKLDSLHRNIKIAENLARNQEINQRIADSELRFFTYDSDVTRPELTDPVYNNIREAIFKTGDLSSAERKYVVERLFDLRDKIEKRVMDENLYYALSNSPPKEIIAALLKQYSESEEAKTASA